MGRMKDLAIEQGEQQKAYEQQQREEQEWLDAQEEYESRQEDLYNDTDYETIRR